MQLPARTDVAALLEQLLAQAIPEEHAVAAWRALIHAHATLMRQLATDLVDEIGLSLGDVDGSGPDVVEFVRAGVAHLERLRVGSMGDGPEIAE